MAFANDISEQRFGRLVARQRVSSDGHKDRASRWECACDCGSVTVAVIRNLRSGHTQSCGCLRSEVTSAMSTTHGHNRPGKRTAEYRAWAHIWNRCTNPKVRGYKNWGGRGITVCDRWRSFENFLADMGKRPDGKTSIDRIDNNKGYEPGNCRWADWFEQASNRRPARR